MQPEVTPIATRLYRVDLGHNTVIVESESVEAAICAARTRLSLELPRLWDVIQQLAPEKFTVSTVY